ncbi:MAG: SIMPL domain-containing protein [Aestuariivirga sp.]|uniref:SIMPL domain-containing protein n=1 Tax=Aestuariivirga sp. TaxID=2650926 RepID=UPI0025BB00B3|nr:SIMPL domain-containing protein [Aestuariivirga sp.]MCA3559653.1 SIMPL domain-containing protein [Aestuariivirga sp.]
MQRLSFAAAAIMGLLAAVSPAFADGGKMPRIVSLTGHGEVRSTPDIAFVTSGVTTQGATAAEALAANTKAMTGLFAALKDAGIESKDIQTSDFSVQPRYDFSNGQAPKLVGYDVSNNVTVKLRKVDTLGALLDKMVQSGSNQVSGISFDVSKREEAMDEARKLATQDATRKAKLYADAMGIELGNVMQISEGSSTMPQPVPFVRGATMMKADAAPVPVAAGEQTLAADVNIIWEIKQP